MDINELNTFVHVVKTGSFTRAALSMGTQKAYVSRVISHLEGKLGVRLLERTTRSLSLTEIGREIFERAVGILAAVEEAGNVAQQFLGEPRGLLRLTCGVEMGMIAVNHWINSYLQLNNDVSVEAQYTNRLIDIVHDGFDIAIRVGRLPDSSLAARRLGQLDYGLYASPSYLKRTGSPKVAQDLSKYSLVMFSAASQRPSWNMALGGDKVLIETTARVSVNSTFAARDACAAGLGIAKLPRLVGDELLKDKRLQRVLSKWVHPSVPVHALFPSTRYLTPKVRSFIDHAVAEFSRS
jgi:LysR family transcriptional regulator, regulator for bpeEF and oprC